ERNIFWIRGFEVRRQVVAITRDQSALDQSRADAFALVNRIHADHRKEPMRPFWVKFSHLLKCCNRVIFLIANTTVKQHDEGLVVGMYIWRKPKCRPTITVNIVCRTVANRPSSVSLCELW